jgi:uncharacterized hydrophobic protein (TIGR00341 family)
MALRIVEIVIDPGNEENVKEAVKDLEVQDIWFSRPSDDKLSIRILVKADQTEKLIDALSQRFAIFQNFRLVIIPVEATLPRIENDEAVPAPVGAPAEQKKPWIKRISRDELHNDVEDSSDLNIVYVITVLLSVLVAAIGLLKDNVAVVIGAMVIAPLLGPNMAMSLATAMGDNKLLLRSAKTLAAGVFMALVLSIFIGFLFEVDASVPEVAYRTNIDLSDVVLALASGAAGALFFTIGTSTALVGVMVAVALLPPLVVLGMLIGSGDFGLAFETLLLFLTNFICVNLAGVAVFVGQGVKPSHWWQSLVTKKSVSYALLIWVILLLVMITLVIIYG